MIKTKYIIGTSDDHSGSCVGVCPIRPIEVLYGQFALDRHRPEKCTTCTACIANCLRAAPERSHSELHRSTLAANFAMGFPGYVAAYFLLDLLNLCTIEHDFFAGRASTVTSWSAQTATVYGVMSAGFMLSWTIFRGLQDTLSRSVFRIVALAAFTAYYVGVAPEIREAWGWPMWTVPVILRSLQHSRPETPRATIDTATAAAYWPPPLTRRTSVLGSTSCAACHPLQFADWSRSRHAVAMGPGVWAQMHERTAGAECTRCHAPLAEQGAGHSLPTYVVPEIWMRIELKDRAGATLAFAEQRIARKVTFDGDDWTQTSDTRLAPDETATLDYTGPVTPNAVAIIGRVVVLPDAWQAASFRSRRVLAESDTVRRYYSAALAEAESSGYTLFQAERRLDR